MLVSSPAQNWETICQCGVPASTRADTCTHVRRLIAHKKLNWQDYLKPWSTPMAWEKQVGELMRPISAQEVLEVCSPPTPTPHANQNNSNIYLTLELGHASFF